jgi:NIPSNAP
MADKPIIDLRICTIRPRGILEYLRLFEELALPIQLRHIGPPIGYYTAEIGALNQVVHLWGFDSLADMEARRAARNADPGWPAYLVASAHLVLAQEDRIIRRVDFETLAD